MASLLNWIGNTAKTVVKDVGHAGNVASRVVDQVNPLDGGRTYQQRTPTRPQASAVQQATHNGATNFAGAIVKPAIRSGMAVTQGIGNAEVGIAHMLGKAPQVHTLNGQQFANQSIGSNLNRAVDYTGTKRQIIGDAVSNVANFAAPGESKVLTAGAAKLVPKVAPKVVAKFAPKIAANAVVGAGTGAASNTGSYIASNQPLTAKNLAKTAGTGAAYGAAFGAALPVAIPAAKVAGKATVTGAKVFDKTLKTAQNKAGTNASIDAGINDITKQQQAIQQRIDKAPLNATRGTESLQQHIQVLEGQKAQLNANRPQMSRTEKVLAIQPGGSMRPVRPATVSEATPKLAQPKPAAKPQLPVSRGTGGVSLPNNTKVRGFTKGIQGSPEFSPKLQKAVNSEYTPFTNKAATQSTDQFMKQKLDDAKSQVMQTLADTTTKKQAVTGEFGKQEVSNAGAVIKALDAKGDVAGAQAVHDLLAAKLTNAGQTGQAAQLIYNRTPEGLKYMAQRDLTKSKVPISTELKAKMDAGVQAIKATKDGTRANDLARAKFQQLVSKQIPTSAMDKGLGLWRTGILSAPETAVKVAVANPINTVLENLADTAAAPIDKAVSLFTHKRSMVAPNARNIKAGASAAVTRGIPDAITRLKDDIALPGTTGMGSQEIAGKGARAEGLNFGVGKNGQRTKLDKATGGMSSKVLNGYTSSIGRVHGGLQVPNYVGRTAQALNQAAEAEAINRGLKGAEKTVFINDFVAHPTPEAKAAADNAAQYATSQQHTMIGQAASGLQHNLGPLGKVIAPITRVPGAVATQMINYSPAGFLKTAGTAALDAKRGGGFDQQAFSRGMGRAVVGTGLTAGGIALAAQGRVSGQYPKDKATQQLWQSANIPANSVYVGGKTVPGQPWKNSGGTWQQISSPGGAAAQSALAGGAAYDGYKNGGLTGAALQGAQGGAQIATNQPYLTGISGAMGAINTPSQAKSFLDQTAGSVVPNFLKTGASATDPLQRQTSVQSIGQSIKNSVTNGIPGLREKNQLQVDVMGNTLQRNNSPVGAYLNPFKPQQSTPSQLTNAMGDIHNAKDVNNKPLPVPTQIAKKYTIKDATGKTTALSDAQRTQFIKQSGQGAQAEMNAQINSPTFKNATPEQQSKQLSDIMSGARDVTKQQFGNATKLTSAGKAYANGNLPTIGTNGKVTTGGASDLNPKTDKKSADILNKYANMNAADRKKAAYSDPAYDYKYAVAKYANDKANGTLTKAQDITARAAINKALVGKDYSKDTRDLYGLSKSEIYDFITSDPNGKKYANDLANYDQALKDNGLITTLKFKNGFGSSSTTTTSSGGTRKTYSAGKAAKRISPPNINAIRAKRVKMTTPKFSAKMPKSPSFKTKRASLPKFAYKTPRVTKKAVA